MYCFVDWEEIGVVVVLYFYVEGFGVVGDVLCGVDCVVDVGMFWIMVVFEYEDVGCLCYDC